MSSSSSSTSEGSASPPLALVATCAPGLEPLLAEELRERGFDVEREERGGVAFRGDRSEMQRANRELGIALSVLWRLARFKAHDFRELEKRLERLPLAQWLPRGGNLQLRAVARRSRLYHTGALEDRLGRLVEEALAPSPEGQPLRLLLRVDHDKATLAVDTSGEPLYRRGYRLASGPAPLRADIACALLRAAAYRGDRPLFDAMTGTGTLAIEAVRLARDGLPLSKPRTFAHSLLPGALPDPAPSTRAPADHAPIVARDRDADAVARARDNARHAGVHDAVLWEVGPLSGDSAIDSLDGPLVVANPPHGKRLGNRQALGRLYSALGKRVQGLGGQLALLTSDTRLAAQTGLGLQSALLTDLGGHKVRFYLGG